MATKTESLHAAAFLRSAECLSIDQITVVSGAGALKAGTVLGKITASGKYKPYDNDATDGSQTAVAILYDDCDATSADQKAAAVVRLAEVIKTRLVWGAGVTLQAEKDAAYADFATVFIIPRD